MARQLILDVKNTIGSTLLAGKAVYATGFDELDQVMTVDLADNTDESKMPALGLVREDILNGDLGRIQVHGIQAGLDTGSARLNQSVFVGRAGNLLFIDQSDMDTGTISQQIGIVTNVAGGSGGQMFVFPRSQLLHAGQHKDGAIDQLSHSELADRNTDGHPIYSLANGKRSFERPVSGITPTSPSHLATKGYVDATIFGSAASESAYVSLTNIATSAGFTSTFNIFGVEGSGPYPTYTEDTHFEFNIESRNITHSANNGRFTVTNVGAYKIEVILNATSTGTPGTVTGNIDINGANQYTMDVGIDTAADPAESTLSVIKQLARGDFIEITVAGTSSVTVVLGTTINITRIV